MHCSQGDCSTDGEVTEARLRGRIAVERGADEVVWAGVHERDEDGGRYRGEGHDFHRPFCGGVVASYGDGNVALERLNRRVVDEVDARG